MKINGKEYDITDFDNADTIKTVLAIEENTLPIYIRLEKTDLLERTDLLEGSSSYKAFFLKNELKGMRKTKIEQVYKDIADQYELAPSQYKNVIFEWANVNKELRMANNVQIDEVYIEKGAPEYYNEYFDNAMKETIENNRKFAKQKREFSKIKPVSVSPFIETGSLIEIVVDVKEKRLVDIFDDFTTSAFIPAIVLNTNMTVYKYSEENIEQAMPITLPKKGNVFRTSKNYIYFKIYNGKQYINVIWKKNNSIVFDIEKYNNLTKDTIINNFFSHFTSKYKIVSQTIKGLKGHFEADIQDFQKYVFADLVFNNEAVSTSFFFNEFCLIETECSSMMMRDKFYTYFGIDRNIDTSLTFLITPKEDNIKITIQKSRGDDQVKSFIETLGRALNIYKLEKDTIEKGYAAFYTIEKTPIKKKEKKILKTKETLVPLVEFDSELFATGFYAKEVDKNKQPMVMKTEEEAKQYMEKHGKEKVMKFTDPVSKKTGWYFCSDNQFPGLKFKLGNMNVLRKGDKAEQYAKWAKNRIGVPKCFNSDQTARVRKALQQFEGKERPEKKTPKQSSYINKIPNKIIEEGKLAVLPQNLEYIFPGYVRKGMGFTNGFIQCVLAAFEKTSSPEKYRKKFAELGDMLNVAKQEMPQKNIKKYIESDKHFDPTLFIKLLEEYFDINIFLYSVNTSDNSLGEVLLPKNINGHFFYSKKEERKSIAILCHDTVFGYHCELIIKNDNAFLNKELFKINNKILKKFNKQLIIHGGDTKIFREIQKTKFISTAKSQGLDDMGRVYLLNYDNFSVFTSPLPPLNIPINDTAKKIEGTESFLKNFEILGVTIDQKGLVVKLESIYESYIPIESKFFKDLPFIKLSIFDDLKYSKSKRDIVIKNKTIANMLKAYALFLWSNHGKLKYEIDLNHSYKIVKRIKEDNKNIVSEKKIIVSNKEIGEKLKFYVKTMIQNYGRKELKKLYQNKTIIYKDYTSISDFKNNLGERVSFELTEKDAIDVPRYSISNKLILDVEAGYFFSNSGFAAGKICIIQNVLDGNLQRALYVAKMWKERKVNMGYDAAKLKEKINYYVFDLLNENTFDNKGDLNVLQYGDNYAAILFL